MFSYLLPLPRCEPRAMSDLQQILSNFVLLWAVIDPIGTVPVFISATHRHNAADRKRIAFLAASTAAGILLFFIFVGESVLSAMGVPILAFQIAGGIVLFLFALTMIFGESKPEAEAKDVRTSHDVAVFPLATPSIASPGAMMAVVLLTQNEFHTVDEQLVTTVLMLGSRAERPWRRATRSRASPAERARRRGAKGAAQLGFSLGRPRRRSSGRTGRARSRRRSGTPR